MTIINLLDELKTHQPAERTPDIADKIKIIKQRCDGSYSDQSFYGNAALNRMMLLDPEIASNLTPDVIQYLFTQQDISQSEKIYRNSTGFINLRDAIYHGFSDGLVTIRQMPSNEPDYSPERYHMQKQKFYDNTSKIIKSILSATSDVGIVSSDEEDQPSAIDDELSALYEIDLMDQFERIVNVISIIKQKNLSKKLCSVPRYSIASMHAQVRSGFSQLIGCIKLKKTYPLDNICEAFLQSPDAMLHGAVIHLFYDRAHFEAALDQDTLLKIGSINYTFEAIFRHIIKKYVESRLSNILSVNFNLSYFPLY